MNIQRIIKLSGNWQNCTSTNFKRSTLPNLLKKKTQGFKFGREIKKVNVAQTPSKSKKDWAETEYTKQPMSG